MSHKHTTLSQVNEIAVLKRSGILQKDIAKVIKKIPHMGLDKFILSD